MFSKGDKVSGMYKGKPFNAIITKVLRGGEKCHFTTVGFEGGDLNLIGTDRGLKPASFEGALPQEEKGPALHVGDHVTTPWKGETVKGVIAKVGPKNVEMRFWQKPSGQGIVGHPKFFTLANHEAPTDPDAEKLKDWEVRNYHFYPRMSEETNAISADIFYKGQKVFRATNHGQGSCNQYDPYGTNLPVKEDALYEAVKAVFESLAPAGHTFIDIIDMWLEWCVSYRPYGVTLKMHIEAHVKETEAWARVSAQLKAENAAKAATAKA